MATVVLIRHGRSTSNAAGTLAGRMPGVHLDETGAQQVADLGDRLAGLRVVKAVSSPLERCQETLRGAVADMVVSPPVELDPQFLECDYGEWQGRTISELASEPLWGVVQAQPSAATFPGGESMTAMSARVVAAVRAHDARVEAEFGAEAVWLLASHGDPLKAILADALGMHLDLFQRLVVDPASVSVVRYGQQRPYVLGINTTAGPLTWLNGASHGATTGRGDAVLGGGAGVQQENAPDRPAGTAS